ncbi:LapA family protein [Nocardia acidivorans]|uniref:LapA family protein n=1 Tax=Nocardia acidivorans TaxID=404580 RepID=UPI00082D78BC|nr:LapA family protein [Nocardia acidivorans]
MFTIIGLIALVAAVAVGVAGIVANSGESHMLQGGFTVFGHTYVGSAGLLFAYGILIGAIGVSGLIMLLAGTWTTSRRGLAARRDLRQSRREMAAARKELGKPVTPAAPAGRLAPPAAQPAPAPAATTPVMAKQAAKPAPAAQQQPQWSLNRFLRRPSADEPANPAVTSK